MTAVGFALLFAGMIVFINFVNFQTSRITAGEKAGIFIFSCGLGLMVIGLTKFLWVHMP